MDNQNVIEYFSEQEVNGLSSMAKWFKGIGFVILVLGMLSVLLPHIGTLTVNLLVASILLFTGAIHLIHVFTMRKWRTMTWETLLGIIFIFSGILFAAYPWSGALALTLLLGLFFLIIGTFKILLALSWRWRPGWGWIMATGFLSILLGLLVVMGLPATAAWVIGLILGLDLIFSGITLIALGVMMNRIMV